MKLVIELPNLQVHVHVHQDTDTARLLQHINDKVNTIMATQAQLAADLQALKDQLDKAKGEIVAKVQALEDALANAGGTTPEVDAALLALKGAAQSMDDLNPDAPAPTT